MQKSLVAVLLILGAGRMNSAVYGLEQPVPFEKALGIVQAIEQGNKKSKWKASATFGTIAEVNGQTRYDQTPKLSFEFSVHFDPSNRKYRCDAKTIEQWVNGLQAYCGHEYLRSFDGKLERNYDRQSGRDQLPNASDPAGDGVIEPEQADRFLTSWGFTSGIGFCAPYFSNYRISDLMQRTAKARKGFVDVREIGPNVWKIRVQDPNVESMAYNLTYDLTKNGWVTEATWEGMESPHPVYGRSKAELLKTPSGEYYPKTIHFDFLVDKRYRRLDFSEFEYDAKYDDSVYQFAFPPGTRVMDMIDKKYYIVGGGPVSDRDQIREFMIRNELDASKDDGSVTQPIRARWKIFSAGVLTAIILVIAIRFSRKRWSHLKGIGVFITAVSACSPASAGDSGAYPSGFGVSEHGKQVAIAQCGYNALAFALEYCHRSDYNVDTICRCLDISDSGISFRQIRDILQANGLFAAIRQDVSWDDLIEHLGRGQMAILPIRANDDFNHYVVIVRHPRRGTLLVDPPRTVTSLDEHSDVRDRLIEKWKPLKSAVLFVRSDEGSSGKPKPGLTPDQIDLGTVTFNNSPTYKTSTCTITNAGDRAMIVSGFRFPCGCLSTNWSSAVIPAGGSKALEVKVDISNWAQADLSSSTREVQVEILGCEPMKLVVAADVDHPARGFRTIIDTNIHRFRLVDLDKSGLTATNSLFANHPIEAADYEAVAPPPWWKVAIASTSADKVSLSMTIVPSALPPIGAGAADVLEETVSIRDRKHQITHKFKIFVDRSFVMKPAVVPVSLPSDQHRTHEMVLSLPPDSKVDCDKIQVAGDNTLTARITSCDSATRTIRCTVETPEPVMSRTYYSLNFEYPSTNGPLRSRVPVVVTP